MSGFCGFTCYISTDFYWCILTDTEENEETKTDDVDRETDVESRVELGDKANDKGDAGGRSVSSYMPPVPIDIVTLNCPKDCLILYPVQPRKSYDCYILIWS